MFADADAFNKKVKVLFLGIGSMESPGAKNFSDQLTKAGIDNVYFESAGIAREWLTWRRRLIDFAPLPFKCAAVQMAPIWAKIALVSATSQCSQSFPSRSRNMSTTSYFTLLPVCEKPSKPSPVCVPV